jgi:hypothetical protein
MEDCRTDRIRHLTTITDWTPDLAYEVLVNPHSPDLLLLEALEHADEQVLSRAAHFSRHVLNLRKVGLPDDPDQIVGVFEQYGQKMDIKVSDKYKLTKILSKAANDDWMLAEQIVDWLSKP